MAQGFGVPVAAVLAFPAHYACDAHDLFAQFFVGPRGSGSPVHFHTDAINLLAYGRKRWCAARPRSVRVRIPCPLRCCRFMYPRWDAFFGSKSILDDLPRGGRQCVQRAGDIVYVPSLYGHGVLNLADVVGIAFEFGISATRY